MVIRIDKLYCTVTADAIYRPTRMSLYVPGLLFLLHDLCFPGTKKAFPLCRSLLSNYQFRLPFTNISAFYRLL